MNATQFLELARKIYQDHTSGMTYFSMAPSTTRNVSYRGRSVNEIIAYSEGRQPVSKYTAFLDKADKSGKALINISRDTSKIFVKFISAYTSLVSSYKYGAEVQAVSKDARLKKSLIEATMKFDAIPAVKQMRSMLGIESAADKYDELDIEMMARTHAIKLDVEQGIEHAIKDVLIDCDASVLETMWLSDISRYNACASHVKFNPVTKKVELEYADVTSCIFPVSAYTDNRDNQYRGFWHRISIEDLRQKGVPVENIGYTQTNTLSGAQMIDVMTIYCVATDIETFITGQRKDGTRRFERVSGDFKFNERIAKEGFQKETFAEEFVYKGTWIPHTDIVYDFGKDYANVKFNSAGGKKAIIPLTIYSSSTPSITEKSIPIIDDLQMVIFKMRQTWANLPALPEKMMDLSLLEETVTIGQHTYNMLELADIATSKGITIYRSKNEYGEETGSNRPPIQTIMNPYAQELLSYKNLMLSYIQDIRDITGINDTLDASSPNPDQLVGVTEAFQRSAVAVVKPEIVHWQWFLGQNYRIIGLKYQAAVVDGDIEGYYFEHGTVQVYKLTKEILSEELAINTVPKIGDQERDLLMQQLYKFSSEGQIPAEMYVGIYEDIIRGDFRAAKVKIVRSVVLAKNMAHKQQLEIQQIQAKGNAEAGVAVEQARQQTLQLEYQLKMEEYKNKIEMDKQLLLFQSQIMPKPATANGKN